MLLTAHIPSGRAQLVLSINTGSYLGTVVKRIPFAVENPEYGKPVAELAETKSIRNEMKGAQVVELFMEAPLPQWGIPAYDGARDVYFGDGRGQSYGGSCQNNGNHTSYGSELRYRLDVGGELRRTLIKYDLSMLPKGTVVKKAMLALNVTYVNKKADLKCNVHAMKRRWHETVIGVAGAFNSGNGPNKRARYPVGAVELWEKPMFAGDSDRHAEPVASHEFKGTGWTAIDVTPAVRNWVSGAWENHGVAIEQAAMKMAYGRRDVSMYSSDYAVQPSLRPRLILALDGRPKAVRHEVAESGDLAGALAKGAASGQLVVVNVLSAGSLTSRSFEGKVLADPKVKAFVDANFIEVRVDGDDRGKYAKVLDAFGVKRLPTTLVIGPKDAAGNVPFEIIEPYDWNALFGVMRSDFEFEQSYTGRLQGVLTNLKRGRKMNWHRTPAGEIRGGAPVACGG